MHRWGNAFERVQFRRNIQGFSTNPFRIMFLLHTRKWNLLIAFDTLKTFALTSSSFCAQKDKLYICHLLSSFCDTLTQMDASQFVLKSPFGGIGIISLKVSMPWICSQRFFCRFCYFLVKIVNRSGGLHRCVAHLGTHLLLRPLFIV